MPATNGKDLLDRDHLRKTKSRKMIMDILIDAHEPLTAEEIFLQLKKRGEPTSLSTVYRTCETLAGKSTISKSSLMEDGKIRYELNDAMHRHHFVCIGCHKIIPIDECPYGDFDRVLEQKFDFDVKGHKLEIYGYCSDCKTKRARK